jgi:hypothetical protein
MGEREYRVPVTGADRARAGLALHLAAAVTGEAPEAVARGRRGSSACKARWLALYLAHVGHGWPLDRVAHAFGVTRSTAGVACRWVEEGRDARRFDDVLDRLEALMRAAFDGPELEMA